MFGWLGAATPHEHPRITTEELVYIMEGGNADVVPKVNKSLLMIYFSLRSFRAPVSQKSIL